MHIRRPPSGDGPKIYRPNESVATRFDSPPRPVAPVHVSSEPDSIPPPPRDTLLSRVNRRRGQILTAMVSVAAVASFGSVVWWAHNQDVKAGGKGLEPLVVQAPAVPARVKPENAGGLVPPNQDKEVYNRLTPNAVQVPPEKLLPEPKVPSLPANGLPPPAPPKPSEPDQAKATPPAAAPMPRKTLPCVWLAAGWASPRGLQRSQSAVCSETGAPHRTQGWVISVLIASSSQIPWRRPRRFAPSRSPRRRPPPAVQRATSGDPRQTEFRPATRRVRAPGVRRR